MSEKKLNQNRSGITASKRAGKLKFVRFKPNLSGYTTPVLDNLSEKMVEALSREVAGSIHFAFTKGDTNFHFPALYGASYNKDGFGGKCPKDPLALYLYVDVNADNRSTYKFSLTKIVKEELEFLEDEDYAKGFLRVSTALRRLAKEIEERVDQVLSDSSVFP